MADPNSITRINEIDGFTHRAEKRATGDANTVAQTLAVVRNLPLASAGTVPAWVLFLWIETSTDTHATFASYVGARARVNTQLFTNTRYNVSTSASTLPTPVVTVNAAAGTITIATTASAVADGAIAYVVRTEYRTIGADAPAEVPYID